MPAGVFGRTANACTAHLEGALHDEAAQPVLAPPASKAARRRPPVAARRTSTAQRALAEMNESAAHSSNGPRSKHAADTGKHPDTNETEGP